VSYPPIVLDRATSLPLYRQIEIELRRSILDGRLGPGAVLPGIRSYARHLGVGAVTVMTAYDQLTAEGYLEPHPGRGTLVAPILSTHGRGLRPRPTPTGGGRLPVPRPGPARPFHRGVRTTPRFDFRTSATSLDLFPSAAWERLLPRAWRDLASDPGPATSYRYPEGDPRLRAELAAYVGLTRAVRADPAQVVVTSGARAALATAAGLWLGPDRPLAVEDPGSPFVARTIQAAGVPLVHVPTDDRGLLVERLPDGAGVGGGAGGPGGPGAPVAVLVTPSWQQPGGGTMPIARRMQLLAWVAARDGVVIEDDVDAEPRYEGQPLPSLQGLDDRGHVLYLGSLSKVMFTGIRAGYAVVPEAALEGFVARHEAAGAAPGALEQRALALFIGEGHLERHLVRMRAHGAERQAAMLDVLSRELGTIVSARPAAAGSHLVVRIEDVRLTASELATRARTLGVAVEPLSFSRHHPAGDQELVLHYARLTPEEIRAGIGLLARAAASRARATA
jgi:GntR family transcriptional regulator/MocR family aminotransferase